jgi:hypothetical protein
MATILAFPLRPPSPEAPVCRAEDADIIMFPGIRYERRDPEGDDPGCDRGRGSRGSGH